MRIICAWNGPHLWGHNGKNGLSLTDEGTWCVVDPSTGGGSAAFNKDHLIKVDKEWLLAFSIIEEGHKPSWKECSCGSQVVMGQNYSGHTPLCESLVLSSPFEPKNNDGLGACYKCGESTRPAGGGQYMVCKNEDCEWYDK